MPSVEVVLCTFNGDAFLAAQLRSLSEQTYAIDRVIVSDDGSTDGTADVLRAFEEHLPLEVARNENKLWVSANFEVALRRARGEVNFLCDQDDVWHTHKVERMLAEAQCHPDAMLLHSDARIVDEGRADTGRRLFRIGGWVAFALFISWPYLYNTIFWPTIELFVRAKL
jgi:glycosyltransferase involved in cell wall biosynthesis